MSVGDDANHTLGLTYTEFIPIIVRAIQQLAAKVSDLADTVAGFAEHFVTKDLVATNITADQIHFNNAQGQKLSTQQLCVGQTCVTESHLAAILAATGQSPAASSGGPSAPAASSTAPAAPSTPPVLTIAGENPAHIHVGDTYADLGATITVPEQDKNLGIKTYLNGALVNDIVLDTSAPATDTIDYVVTDTERPHLHLHRTVIIETVSE